VAFAAGTVVLTDFVSSTLIKENIWRLRPCNNPDLSSWINIMVGYRPQSSSFTSSHAANHFGIATFLYLSLKEEFGKWPMFFFLWAFAISYAQVYVGVHYPLDVIAGTGIGLLIGYLTGRLFNKNFGLTIPHV
jgi:undecaprenyl-diphosphatase